jgi:ornithine cyclodeaminase/alanine dehydrogenase-like protein (mu-crystallin family)
MTATLLLTRDDLRALVLTVGLDRLMDLGIEQVEALLHQQASGVLEIRAREGFVGTGAQPSVMEWMPILRKGHHSLVKHVGYHPDNPSSRDLPTIVSALMLFDEESGHLRTVCDGTFLTAVRTGAASAVASRVLAAPDSTTLGLVGCGAQAVTQLHALSRLFPLARVLFYDSDPGAHASFPLRASRFGMALQPSSPSDIAEHSDIICTVTSVAPHRGPVIELESCRPWLHVNAVGSDLPGKTELSRSFLEQSLVVPDFTVQASREGESQQLDAARIGPELHEVVRHAADYAAWRGRTTVFDSTGFALEDLAVLEIVERLARDHGIGSDIEIEAIGADPRDPYGFLEGAPAETFVRALAVGLGAPTPSRHG